MSTREQDLAAELAQLAQVPRDGSEQDANAQARTAVILADLQAIAAGRMPVRDDPQDEPNPRLVALKTSADVLERGAVLARTRPDLVAMVNVEMREEQVRLEHARARGMPGLAAMSMIETFEVRLVRLADTEAAGGTLAKREITAEARNTIAERVQNDQAEAATLLRELWKVEPNMSAKHYAVQIETRRPGFNASTVSEWPEFVKALKELEGPNPIRKRKRRPR